jgi:hypothetical protein
VRANAGRGEKGNRQDTHRTRTSWPIGPTVRLLAVTRSPPLGGGGFTFSRSKGQFFQSQGASVRPSRR